MINLFTTRLGTALIALAWVMSWGLLWFDGMFFMFPVSLAILFFFGIGEVSSFGERNRFDCFPTTRKQARHNQRAKILRQIERLKLKERQCVELVDETYNDDFRMPILEAERDDARRRQDRLREDVRLLEEQWISEDRERRYQEITGSKN